jgi:hypothetical protein
MERHDIQHYLNLITDALLKKADSKIVLTGFKVLGSELQVAVNGFNISSSFMVGNLDASIEGLTMRIRYNTIDALKNLRDFADEEIKKLE